MEEAQEPVQEELAGNVMESLGEPREKGEEVLESQAQGGGELEDLPQGVRERIWRQERKHKREMRNMQSRLDELNSQMRGNQTQQQPNQMAEFYGQPAPSGVDEQIHKAVSFALQHRDMEERKAKEAEHHAHVQGKYHALNRHLDEIADRYTDFDDVVRGDSMPFTAPMRDAALLLPKKGPGSAGEVLYKLGKNPQELERISRLHPVDQAEELIQLSAAMVRDGETSKAQPSRPLGQIKSNPMVNNQGINDKTSISDLRQRMKSGKKYWS